METKHTPTPWMTGSKIVNNGQRLAGMSRIYVPNEVNFTLIADCASVVENAEVGAVNAEFIVRVCNAHDELVEVLMRARGIIQMVDDAEGGQIDLLSAIDARLAKASKEA